MKRFPLWKYFNDYFPIRLIKTVDLDPRRNYIFCTHPHGVLCTSNIAHFILGYSKASEFFPGLKFHTATLNINFYFPILRDYSLALGEVIFTLQLFVNTISYNLYNFYEIVWYSGNLFIFISFCKFKFLFLSYLVMYSDTFYYWTMFHILGFVSASKDSLIYLLRKNEGGNVVNLMVGGSSEAYFTEPGDYRIILNKRKGFIRIALNSG